MIRLTRISSGNFFRRLAMGFILLSPLSAAAADNARLQLKWDHQFQFAGYYAAQAQGYYKAAGLDIEIIPGRPGVDPVQQVLRGKAEFGVGGTDLMLVRQRGEPVVVLAVIFQHSPLAFLTLKRNGLQNIHDLAGRRVMIEPGSSELYAYLRKEGLPSEKFTPLTHDFSAKDLLSGKAYAMSAYVTDEPFELEKAGHDYILYSPRSAGIDFYGDNLFTTESLIKLKPEMVKAFRTASLKGWDYAMRHPEELAQLIYTRYSRRHSIEHLRFEARQMELLLQASQIELGHMDQGRWRHIAETYAELGMIKPDFGLKGFLYRSDRPMRVLRPHYIFTSAAALLFAVILLTALYVFRIKARLRLEAAERKKVEEALFSETLFSDALFGSVPGILYVYDEHGKFVRGNKKHEEFTGYSAEELSRMNPLSWYDDEADVARVKAAIDEVFTNGYGEVEAPMRIKNGQKPLMHFNGVRLILNGKKYFVGVGIDITKRKLSEEAHRESEGIFSQFMTFSPIYIFVKDEKLRLIKASSGFSNLLGKPVGELLGKSSDEIFPPEFAKSTTGSDLKVLKDGAAVSSEEKLNNRVYSTIKFPIRRESGKPDYLGGFMVDITERRLAELEKERLLTSLIEKNREMENFLYITTHDLRSPLVNIQGFSRELESYIQELRETLATALLPQESKLALNKLTEDSIPEALKIVLEGTRKMDSLITSLLKVSRLKRVEMTPETVDMNKLAGEILKSLRYQLEAAGGVIRCGGLPPCKADPLAVHQLFTILLDNAVKYRHKERALVVNVTGEVKGGMATYTVADNGSGIPAVDLHKIWNVFYQPENSLGIKGEGVGLPLARRLAENNGGGIRVESQSGTGSAFRVKLPASEGN